MIAAAVLIGSVNAEELRTLVAKPTYIGLNYSVGYSESVEIAEGEWVEVVGSSYSMGSVEVTVHGTVFRHFAGFQGGIADSVNTALTLTPVKVAGPASVRLRSDGNDVYVTLAIHRVSSPTTPAAIPAKPGQNFAVVLESSSDLIYWTPAAPGTYAGTEPKRFFRVRIDRE